LATREIQLARKSVCQQAIPEHPRTFGRGLIWKICFNFSAFWHTSYLFYILAQLHFYSQCHFNPRTQGALRDIRPHEAGSNLRLWHLLPVFAFQKLFLYFL
jgi:hypothetical protein